MKEDWKEVSLNEFVWFQRGYDLPKTRFKEGSIPVYGSTSILGYHDEFKVKGPGIVTGRSGTLGVMQYSKDDFWPHNTSLWVKDFKGNNEKFAYYLLSCLDFSLFNSGGAVPTLNRNVLNAFVVNVPPLPTQQKIADILSAYDDLIENNIRRIELLEEQAQLIYEEWFIRMKFPNHENTQIDAETGLPEGWSKKYLTDVLNFKTGKLDSNAHVENGAYDFYTCAKEVYKTNTFCFEGEAVLLGGNNATGNFALFYVNDKFDAYQRTYIVTAQNKSLPLSYVFFYIEKLLPYFRNVSSGASTKFLTMKIFNKTKILIPDSSILAKYDALVKPCFDSIILYKRQNQLLKEARDILLPRLMTGIIEI